MVMGLVLEKKQPVLGFAVDLDLNLDGAGVNLLRLVKLVKLSCLLQIFAASVPTSIRLTGFVLPSSFLVAM